MGLRDVLASLGVLLVFGCGGGGGGGGGGGNPVSVAVNPNPASVAPSANQTFTATVTNAANTAVTWSVVEANGGTVTTGGVYTAPALAGTYHVKASSVQDPTKSSTATVNVHVVVTVNPPNATVSVGDPQNFSATVAGSANQVVSWSVQEAQGGTVSATGVYTAPGAPGTYHVIATSQADPTQSASATVTVQAGGAAGTIQ